MDNITHIGTPGRSVLFIAFLVASLSLPGCSLLRKAFEKTVIVTVTETKDSIIIRDRYIHDTAKVEIPIYIEKNVTKDDSSHLENPFAISDAWVKDGLLHHSLRTRGGTIDVPVDVHVSDTTTIHESSESHEELHEKEVYIEKPLTWWQKFRIDAFWWLLGGLVLSLLCLFRKPLFAMIKKWLPV